MAGGPKIAQPFKPLESYALLKEWGSSPLRWMLDENAISPTYPSGFLESWTRQGLDIFFHSRQSDTDAFLALDGLVGQYKSAYSQETFGNGDAPRLRNMRDAIDRILESSGVTHPDAKLPPGPAGEPGKPIEQTRRDWLSHRLKELHGLEGSPSTGHVDRELVLEMWLGEKPIPTSHLDLTGGQAFEVARLLLSVTQQGPWGLWTTVRNSGLGVDERNQILAGLGERFQKLQALFAGWLASAAAAIPPSEKAPNPKLDALLSLDGAEATFLAKYEENSPNFAAVAGMSVKKEIPLDYIQKIPGVQLEALEDYTWATFKDVNDALRNPAEADPLNIARAALINAALTAFPPFEGLSFRFTKDAPGRYDAHQPGATVREDGFLSMADQPHHYQLQFSSSLLPTRNQPHQVMLAIHTLTGRKLPKGLVKDESEVIGLPGTEYQVIARDTVPGLGGEPMTLIVMAEVPVG
jgi:hypothetical protein